MIKFNIREGFWGLGKSFDIAHSKGIKLPATFSKEIGEGRFFIQQFFMAFANAGLLKSDNSEEVVVEVDRSPYWMKMLTHFNLTPDQFLFFGAQRSKETIASMVNDLVDYWDKFQYDSIMKYPIKIDYKIYVPADYEQYAEWLKSQFANPTWRASKLIRQQNDMNTQDFINLVNHGTEFIMDCIDSEVKYSSKINLELVTSKRNFDI